MASSATSKVPPAVAPRSSSAHTESAAPHSSGKRAPPPPPQRNASSSSSVTKDWAPPPPPADDEAPALPPSDEEAPPVPEPTDEEIVAERTANISLGDVENASSTFKPFDDLFEKDELDLASGGDELGMENIDIAQQLKDQETNEPSIDDL